MKAIVTIGKMIVNSITQQATGREETAFLIDLELPAQYWALSKYWVCQSIVSQIEEHLLA